MIEEQLIEYIRISRQQGRTDDEIRNDLLNAGWQESQLGQAFTGPGHFSTKQGVSIILPPFFQLASRALEIFRQRFWKLLIISIISAVIGALPNISNNLYTTFPLTVIYYLFSYFTILAGAFIINSNLGIARAYKGSLKFLGSYLWLSMISFLIITGGMIALIVPGVFFLLTFIPAIYVLINDEGRGLAALQKIRGLEKGSNYLIRAIQFNLFAIVIFIVFLIISLAAFFLVSKFYHDTGFLADLTLLRSSPLQIFTHIPWPYLLVTSLFSFLMYFVLPYLTFIYYFVLYEQLKISKGRIEADLSDGWTRVMKFLVWIGSVVAIGVILLFSTQLINFFYLKERSSSESPKTTEELDSAYQILKRDFEPLNSLASTITNNNDPEDAADLAMIREKAVVLLENARKWQPDAVFYGFRRTFSVPEDLHLDIPPKSDSYYFESAKTKDNYEVLVDYKFGKLIRTDINHNRQIKYLDRFPTPSDLKIGPKKALIIADLTQKFIEFRVNHNKTIIQAYLNEPSFNSDNSSIWLVSIGTESTFDRDNSVTVAVDGRTGELMNPRILNIYREIIKQRSIK